MTVWFGKLIYKVGTSVYFNLVKVLSPFNKRAAKLIGGQKGLMELIRKSESGIVHSAWIHASSLGEFEMAKPIIEGIRKSNPDLRIIVTFFSPSGYEIRKNDPLCDAVYYLPFESKHFARELILLFNPKFVIWVKYDFWFHYLNELRIQNIPVYLISARFRENQLFFKSFGQFQQSILKLFAHIFCIDANSVNLLQSIGIKTCSISGDTRFDRVIRTLEAAEELPLIQRFKENEFLVIAGSSYAAEENLIFNALNHIPGKWKVVIAPHHPSPERVKEICTLIKQDICLYSELVTGKNTTNSRVLLIDNVGLLSRIYRYGNLALIGGGFNRKGLHNTLEAATFGMPVLFGPNVSNFPEAGELIQQGVGKTISSTEEFNRSLGLFLSDPVLCSQIAEKSRNFIFTNKGATEKVLNMVLRKS